MAPLTAMDILKRLPRNNCRDCGFPTCMAFAAMITQGRAKHSQCPHMEQDSDVFEDKQASRNEEATENIRDDLIGELKSRVLNVDFKEAAQRIGAVVSKERVILRIFGKRFEIDKAGDLHSDCHINPWVHGPILNYILDGNGSALTGDWVTFGELRHTRDWRQFFAHRCENGMQKIVEEDPDLFFDAMDMFATGQSGATKGEVIQSADYLALIHPFPKLPILIVFWKAEEEFDATLSLLFDRSAENNLSAESMYTLVMGLLEMIKRIMARHGFSQS